MKVLILNGSPKADGNTARALREVAATLEGEGVATETVHVGALPVRGCLACGRCAELGRCVIDGDGVNALARTFEQADGLIVGSPVYYASPAGTLLSLLDRLFHATRFDKTMKVGAAVAVARRGGATATFDVLNKYFTISGMPVVPSRYWNILHGCLPGEVEQDAEGLQTMRALGRNAAFLIKAIRLARDAGLKPGLDEPRTATNFIRQPARAAV